MDQNALVFGGLGVAATGVFAAYIILVLISPQPRTPAASEETCRSPGSDTYQPLARISDEASVDLSVVIPAYNETARLPIMLETAVAHLRKQKTRTYEVLIVDDGSSDDTANFALKLGVDKYPELDMRVVLLERNSGKGGAVRHGMMHARGRRLLMVDADGASRFEDLEGLWKAMDDLAPLGSDGAGVTIGSRAHLVQTEAVVKRSFIRNFLMHGLHAILRILGVGHIRDTQCGFKLFSRRAAREIFPSQHLTTWIFDVELLVLAEELSIPVTEVPIEWHEIAGSKLNVLKDSLQMLRDLLILRGNHMFGRWKMVKLKSKAD